MKIRLTKLSAVENPLFPTLNWSEYTPGLGPNDRIGSPPTNYYVEGELWNGVEIGKSINLTRTNRNGVECWGLFATSQVVKVEDDKIFTKNSVYSIEYLDENK